MCSTHSVVPDPLSLSEISQKTARFTSKFVPECGSANLGTWIRARLHDGTILRKEKKYNLS